MLRQLNEPPDRPDNGLTSRLEEAAVLKYTEFFLTEGLLFICVPEWEGWEYISHEKYESVDHFARWEVFFSLKGKRLYVFLRIAWPSLTQIRLRFIYPDDRRLLEEIVLHRRFALIDRPLLNGQPNPLSSGIIVDDIPTDVLEVVGIGFNHGENTLH